MKSLFATTALLIAGAVFSLWLLAQQGAPGKSVVPVPTCAEIDALPNTFQGEQLLDTLFRIVRRLEQTTGNERQLGCAIHRWATNATRPDSAIVWMKRATQIRMGVLSAGGAERDDSVRTAGSFYNLGAFYLQKDNPPAAIPYFDTAIAIYQKADLGKVSFALRDKGNALDKLGDFYQAKIYFSEAIRAALAAGTDGLLAQAYLDMSKSLNLQGEYQAAIDTARKALPLVDYTPDPDRNKLIGYQNIGDAYDYLTQYDSAIAYFQNALPLCTDDEEQRCNFLNYLGNSYRKKAAYQAAKTALSAALRIAKRADLSAMEAAVLDNLGEVSLDENQPAAALSYFRQAQRLVWSGGDLSKVANKSDLLTYLYDEGKTLCRLPGQDTAALDRFEKADALLDLMRREHRREESKLVWRKNLSNLHEQALEACFRLGNVEKAFFFLEKSKSVLLHDALAGRSALPVLGDSLGGIVFQLQTDLSQAREQYESAQTPENRGAMEAKEAQLDERLAFVKKSYPALFDTKVISLDSARAALNDSTCLIQYFYGDSNLYALAVFPDAPPRFERIKRDSSLHRDLQRFADFSGNPGKISGQKAAYFDLAHRLFQAIFRPVYDPRHKNAVIVPDGPLAFIPFDALLTGPYPSGNYAAAPYLLFAMQTQLAWSATIRWNFQSRYDPDQVKNGRLAFFAPETFGEAGLVGLEAESFSRSIHQLFGEAAVHIFRGPEASVDSFRQNCAGYSVFHFHTHAQADEVAPPRLHFYGDSMSIDEFYRTKIAADLFVLGACKTNLGAYQRGEGVYSLSRALAGAGVPSLISSLWEVPPESTEEIFGYYYENLKAGKTKADALFLAKKRYLRDYKAGQAVASPYYWAAWTFAGRDNTLSFVPESSSRTAFWWIAGLAAAGAFLMFWRFQKK